MIRGLRVRFLAWRLKSFVLKSLEGCQGVEDFLVSCSNLSKVIFVSSILSMVIENFLVWYSILSRENFFGQIRFLAWRFCCRGFDS